jgi:GTP-binding protein
MGSKRAPSAEPKPGDLVFSALAPSEMPIGNASELAFMGRSNAGKSSLINALVGRRIARASQNPGKTVRIHFYLMPSWFLVDLPGFGYAKVSKVERHAFGQSVEAYLTSRQALIGGILIQDCRRDPSYEEAMVVDWAESSNRFLVIVANKMDKLNRREQEERRARLSDMYRRPVLMVSSTTGEGIDAVKASILGLGLQLP